MLHHAEELASELIAERNLTAGSMVLEVASNDGYLLQFFKKAGVPVLGIEPARNVARIAQEEKNIPTIPEFFESRLALELKKSGKSADLIVANNVLAHVENINDFVESVRLLLKPHGSAVFEVPYLRDLVEKCEFDTIYHEHLYYFSVTALHSLFARHGLTLVNVERIPLHGGSLKLFVGHANLSSQGKTVDLLLNEEKETRLATATYFESLIRGAARMKDSIRNELGRLKREGKKLAAYGAAAKGTMLLNYCELDGAWLDFIVDQSIHKQGKVVPGVHLPIYSPEKLLQERPDYTLLLPWNFAEEILTQQSRYRGLGGKFIIPGPQVKTV